MSDIQSRIIHSDTISTIVKNIDYHQCIVHSTGTSRPETSLLNCAKPIKAPLSSWGLDKLDGRLMLNLNLNTCVS